MVLWVRAPAANRLKFIIHGKSAHAGSAPEKGINLQSITDEIVASFDNMVANGRFESENDGLPWLEATVEKDYAGTRIPEDHHIVALAGCAAANLGRTMKSKSTGGGSAANIFFEKGIITVVLGTGMENVHTVNEFVRLDDMVKAGALLIEIIRQQART